MKALYVIGLIFLLLAHPALAQEDPMGLALKAIEAKDYARAATLLEPIAAAGNPGAQQLLGGLYESGLGVPVDMAMAASWYGKAAEQGLAYPQFLLGDMLMAGIGVQRDSAKALEWYRKAAEQGLAQGQFRLGMLLQEGALIGGPPSTRSAAEELAEAASWFRKAAAQGDRNAASRLDAIILGEVWNREAIDAFTYVDAMIVESSATISRTFGGRIAYIKLGPGFMAQPSWDAAHADQVIALAATFSSNSESKLASTQNVELPAAVSAEARGTCEPGARELKGMEVANGLLKEAADPNGKHRWFGAVQRDHVVVGYMYAERDDYFGLLTFYAHPFFGNWTGSSAELWNPTHTCAIVLKPR